MGGEKYFVEKKLTSAPAKLDEIFPNYVQKKSATKDRDEEKQKGGSSRVQGLWHQNCRAVAVQKPLKGKERGLMRKKPAWAFKEVVWKRESFYNQKKWTAWKEIPGNTEGKGHITFWPQNKKKSMGRKFWEKAGRLRGRRGRFVTGKGEEMKAQGY